MLPLDRWPRAESVRFLGERRGEADDDRAADRVADALGDLPPALEQAAAYCEQTGTTLSNYADPLEQGYGAELWREPRDLERTVAAVWEVSFSKVEADSPACAVLLQFCAFLAPDNIPLDAIRAGAGAAGAAEGSGRPSGGVQYGGRGAASLLLGPPRRRDVVNLLHAPMRGSASRPAEIVGAHASPPSGAMITLRPAVPLAPCARATR